MEARLAALNLSHYTATLQAHEIDDDIGNDIVTLL